MPIIVFESDPRSIVEPQPISTLSSIITTPTWGYLKFESLLGKKPNPFFPITHPSKIWTLFLINEFLIITFEPIEQLFPITTFFSIIELWPIKQFEPILTFSPIKTFFPNLTVSLNWVLFIFSTVLSKSSVTESG